MSEATHTPGPWLLDEGLPGGVYSDDATGSIVARCMGVGFESVARPAVESRANARLIAAAPKMLAALAPFEDVDGEGSEDFPDETKVVVTFGRTTYYALTLGDFRRARAAITKATDESAP